MADAKTKVLPLEPTREMKQAVEAILEKEGVPAPYVLARELIIAALSAAPQPAASDASAGADCTCQRCNRAFLGDLLVPDDVWAQISPRPVDGWKSGGLLCAACIVDAIAEKGIWTAAIGSNITQPAASDVPHDVVRAEVIAAIQGVKDRVNGENPHWLNQSRSAASREWIRDACDAALSRLATPAPSTSTEEALRAENARLRAALDAALTGLDAGCKQYAARSFGGSEVAGDEQYPWVAAMMRGRDRARTALSALSR